MLLPTSGPFSMRDLVTLVYPKESRIARQTMSVAGITDDGTFYGEILG